MSVKEKREKTQTQIFRAGSGQVSIKKISGFSCHALEKPESSGRGGFRIFSGFCTLYPRMMYGNTDLRQELRLFFFSLTMETNTF